MNGRRRWTESPSVAVLRVLPATSMAGTVLLAGVVTVEGLLPVGFVLAVGWLTAEVTGAGEVWPAFWVFASIWLGTQLVRTARIVVTTWLGQRLTAHLAGIVLAAGVRPVGLGHLEDPAYADRFQLAEGVGTETASPGMAVSALASVASTRLRAAATAVTLTAVLWWAAVPLAVVWMLTGAALGREFAHQLAGMRQRTEDLRRAAYLRSVALGLAEAKEVRVFGLGDWLCTRFSTAWTAGMAALFQRRPAATARLAAAVVGLIAAYTAVVGTLTGAAVGGELTVAALVVGVQAAIAATLGRARRRSRSALRASTRTGPRRRGPTRGRGSRPRAAPHRARAW